MAPKQQLNFVHLKQIALIMQILLIAAAQSHQPSYSDCMRNPFASGCRGISAKRSSLGGSMATTGELGESLYQVSAPAAADIAAARERGPTTGLHKQRLWALANSRPAHSFGDLVWPTEQVARLPPMPEPTIGFYQVFNELPLELRSISSSRAGMKGQQQDNE